MKISVDVGALCADNNKRFGNYTFTKNFIEGLNRYDKTNQYFLYSFCDKPHIIQKFLTKNIHYRYLFPPRLWMKARVSLEELMEEKDIYLALNQAIPPFTNAKIISFSHGLSFYFYPAYYPDSFEKMQKQLEQMATRSKYIIVTSKKVKKEMQKIYPNLKNIKVLPFGIPFDLQDNQNDNIKTASDTVKTNLKNEKYFLFVGMSHQIKNIDFLCKTFKLFSEDQKFADYKLYLVTESKEYEKYHKKIKVLTDVKRAKLKKLYQYAKAFVTVSHYESFHFPIVEALSQDCQVIAMKSAIIPELEDYVNVCDNHKEFITCMKSVAKGYKIEINQKKLKRDFSWRNFVKGLVKLYV